MTTNQIISARILAGIARGMTLPEAYDAVMGAGAYDAMVDKLYVALKAKGQAR